LIPIPHVFEHPENSLHSDQVPTEKIKQHLKAKPMKEV